MANIDIGSIETMTQALARCVEASEYEPKQVAAMLDIEVGHLGRALRENDSRNLPQDKIVELMRVCGNVIPLEWLAAQMGYALHEESLRSILEAIRDAMTKDGKDVKYRVLASGRVERA